MTETVTVFYDEALGAFLNELDNSVTALRPGMKVYLPRDPEECVIGMIAIMRAGLSVDDNYFSWDFGFELTVI